MSISQFDNLKTTCEFPTKSSDGHLHAHHWRSLNDCFSRLTNRSMETGICLLLAQRCPSAPAQVETYFSY